MKKQRGAKGRLEKNKTKQDCTKLRRIKSQIRVTLGLSLFSCSNVLYVFIYVCTVGLHLDSLLVMAYSFPVTLIGSCGW